MKKVYILPLLVALAACGDNNLGINPKNEKYPFQLVLDADEGGALPDAEDYDVEVKFADYLGELPNTTMVVHYEIKDLEDDMVGAVSIDKIVYEVELDDCTYERELDFTSAGLTGTITLAPDPDLGSVPESFEVVFTLPGSEDTEGSFVFEITSLETEENAMLGLPATFEYEVLDTDVAGEWELELQTEEEFEAFKQVFAPLNTEMEGLAFEDITGKVTAEFEFGEMKFEIELVEEEEVTTCEDGVTETETVNKVIEIEAEYDAEDGQIEFEGSHVAEDDGEEKELDFILEAEYSLDSETITFTFLKLVDEDHYKDGDELFAEDEGISFTFEKD